jgi:NAD(P)-dependent dehydrogenase (short-subunit alcohol dehydrogenase family)
MSTDNQYTMQDPLAQYPKPPFAEQIQPEPGLANKMDPKPDHGEQSYEGFGRLKGRKALVTGGDSGIGRAAAIAFAREGASVAINYLPEEESDAQEVIELLTGEGCTVVALPGDISNEDFCRKLIDDAVEKLGGLDILANVAGKQIYQEDIQNITTPQFDQTFRTNVYATFWLCKFALPHMPKGATIINTTSIQAYQSSAGLVDYASTKGAIMAFTEALAKQQAKKGIRVNAVAPGPIWTPLQPSYGQPTDKVVHFGEQVPMGRPGQPAELAPIYVLLASQESSYVTGEVYGVTGGNPLP